MPFVAGCGAVTDQRSLALVKPYAVERGIGSGDCPPTQLNPGYGTFSDSQIILAADRSDAERDRNRGIQSRRAPNDRKRQFRLSVFRHDEDIAIWYRVVTHK